MRHLFIAIALFVLTNPSFAQNSKEKEFSLTLKNVVAALSGRDSAALVRYIDINKGVYILNRIGVMDSYKHFKTLGFSDSTYPNLPFYDSAKLTPLKYSKLPEYDCEKWTKTGTFVDTTRTDHLLSDIAKNLNKEFENEVPEKRIAEFYELENKSRRVVIAENNGNELIIYLSFMRGKWFLTIIDKVTCDCST
jgi:hypothetical protein